MIHPAVRDLLQSLGRHPAFQDLLHHLITGHGGELSLSGLTTTAKALYMVLSWQATGRRILVVTGAARQAEALAELVQSFFDLLVTGHASRPQIIPALDVLPHQRLAPHTEIAEQRAAGLYRLATGDAPITVTPLDSALYRAATGDYYRQLALTLRTGEDLPLDDLLAHLNKIGYEKREPVEMTGEYSVRGGIVDIFPAEAARPVRVEFYGDTVESIRQFDPNTQRSVLKIGECTVLPLREAASDDQHPDSSLVALAGDALIILDEPDQLPAAAERFWKRLERPEDPEASPEIHFLTWAEFQESLAARTRLLLRELDILTGGAEAASWRIESRPSMKFHGNMSVAVSEARNLVEQGYRILLFAASTGELERLADIFTEYSVPFQLGLDPSVDMPAYLAERSYFAATAASISLAKGLIRRGAQFAESRLAIIGAEDLFDTSEMVSQPAPAKAHLGAFTPDLADLKPGDHVVHATHGIGRFVALREIVQGEQKGDFMVLEYADEAKLYVPLTRLDLISKYSSGGEAPPALDRLGGVSWTKTKSKVKARMRDMADELLKLYAARKTAEGFRFSADSNWQREFEDSFEFTETNDQLTATREIKRDMESPQPMDRLLCGDVGFGKTEVAMRAAFKALGDGKQVAVLAPTTVLCFQHFETFKRRFAPFPVRVEMVSRFRQAKELKQIAAEIADGKVDIAIGTHRLLSKDVEFRDLGLVVVDEEQRFGVRHKERFKQLRQEVDVLTLTATPIPRTLHMSLLGLRDLSVIETPPKDRLAIHTVVAHFQPKLIRTAIEQELVRGGQVYYLHNRVDTIYNRASMIQELAPDCRVSVGHGQMGEAELEKVMLAFMRHEFDVLVCTTIIENGLDIPLANTIIIENAERHGLSELYQLRGRVGRSNRRAYAYLLVPPDAELTEVARKRLAALREFSELGAGFKIAALDLELRGGGNLLGGEQSGHIAAVGYETYVSLLEETVQELRGEKPKLEVHATISLGLDLRIPPAYIGDEHQRLRAYKRIADATGADDTARILEEFEDRYGRAPDAVRLLLQFSVLKSLAERLGVTAIDRRGGALNLQFHGESRIEPQRLMQLVSEVQGAQFTPAGILRLPLAGGEDAAAILSGLEQRLLRLASPS